MTEDPAQSCQQSSDHANPVPQPGKSHTALLWDGSRPIWNMTTFRSRLWSYARITSPLNMFKSSDDIADAQSRLKSCVAGATPRTGTNGDDVELQNALQVVDSAVHPETNEVVPLFFRRCAFTLFNTPLFVGIALTPQTLGWVIGWQVVNQTYNAVTNYFNRSSTEDGALKTLTVNFALAVSTATGAAVVTRTVLNRWVQKSSSMSKGFIRPVLVRFAPAFVATVGSSSLNMFMVRREELDKGVAVRVAPHGDATVVGTSKLAAFDAMVATLESRALLPMITLTAPTLLAEYLASRGGFLSRSVFRLPAVTAAVLCCQLLSLPLSLAPWPWFMHRQIRDLEPNIRDCAASHGLDPSDFLYFNKGL